MTAGLVKCRVVWTDLAERRLTALKLGDLVKPVRIATLEVLLVVDEASLL